MSQAIERPGRVEARAPRAAPRVLVGLAAILVACSGGAGSPAPRPSSAVPTVAASAASSTPLASRLVATVRIDNPDEMAVAAGSVWVKTDDGRVVQVDPRANRVVGEIKVDTTSEQPHYCQGLGSDGTRLWACAARGEGASRTIDVVRIDPVTRRIAATFAVAKIFHQLRMPVLRGHLWVLVGTGDKVVAIDIATDRQQPPIELGARCTQLAVAGEMLLATCGQDDAIIEIDAERRIVGRRVRFEDARVIAVGPDAVWIAQRDAVARLDRTTLQPTLAISGLPKVGTSGDLVLADEGLWIRMEGGFLYRVDPDTGQVAEHITTSTELSGGSLLVTDGAIWTTAADDRQLLRLQRT